MNEYIEALQQAINTKGIEHKCIATNFDGSNPYETIITEGKQGIVGNYQVVWHNRWCFYYKGEMIAAYFDYKHSDYVCKGNDISKVLSRKLYPMIIEAVRTVLHKEVNDRILVA